jgi:hypothetical protein
MPFAIAGFNNFLSRECYCDQHLSFWIIRFSLRLFSGVFRYQFGEFWIAAQAF